MMETEFGCSCPHCGGRILYCRVQQATFSSGEVLCCTRYGNWHDLRTLDVAKSDALHCRACRHETRR